MHGPRMEPWGTTHLAITRFPRSPANLPCTIRAAAKSNSLRAQRPSATTPGGRVEGRGQEAKPLGVVRAGDSHADGLGQTQGPSCQNIHATASATPGLPGDPELAGCKGQSY